MDDLTQQINSILSDPQSMQQLQSMASALGLGGNTANSSPQPQPASTDKTALSGLLSTLDGNNSQPQPPAQNSQPLFGGITPEALQAVSRLAPLLSQVNQEDDSTRLLRALRPLLGEPRRKKLDEAVKILQMMRLLPLLKDSGLFSGLLSGLM